MNQPFVACRTPAMTNVKSINKWIVDRRYVSWRDDGRDKPNQALFNGRMQRTNFAQDLNRFLGAIWMTKSARDLTAADAEVELQVFSDCSTQGSLRLYL
jgi:hypothetical protein